MPESQGQHDIASRLAQELQVVHRTFEIADEVYRLFRIDAIIKCSQSDHGLMPVEWVPNSVH